MARTIAVALPKGGVGKTTTAVNLASSLAVAERRTLLIDLDSVGSSGLSFGLTEWNAKAGIYDLFNFVTGIRDTIHRTDLEYLQVIPSCVKTFQMEERLLRLSDNRSLLRNLLRPILPEYDYIILDCPPLLRGLTTNALVAADSVLIPVRCGHFSLDAVDKLFKYLEHLAELTRKPVPVEGILLTMMEPNTRVTDMTLRHLRDRYGRHILKTSIPKNSLLSEVSFYGKPAVLHSISSKGAEAYLALAREVMSRERFPSQVPSEEESSRLRKAE